MGENNKFQFVSLEENNEEIVDDKKVEVLIDEEPKKEEDTTITVSKKRHFSFEERIIVSVLVILLLFAGACFLGLKVINHTTMQEVKYVENVDFTYQVCLKTATCLPENTSYNSSNINIIKLTFKYDAKYAKRIKINNNYRVLGTITVASKETQKVLYQKNVDLVEKTPLSFKKDNYSVTEIVTVDYAKYKELLKDYTNADKQIEVVFYLEENNQSRSVSSLVIPLSKDIFELNKHTTINENRKAKEKVNVWDTYSLIYAIASSFLTIVSLSLIYRTTRLVLKVTNNKSDYEEEVERLLKEYDSIIVVAQDGYESILEREVIKVDEFEELVKVRDEIGKPIIFSKVNNVKSEFIVEDDKVLYKYVIKEADFTD